MAAEIDHMLKDAIEKSRSLSHELSPAVMHHGDLGETFRWLAGQVQAKHGLAVSVEAQGEVRSESDALKGFLYKAAQEFLFNVVKHARVNQARIRVRRFGRYLYLSVSDRGRGFDPQGLREVAGFGLLNIRERVELLGGRMKIKSAPDQGSAFSIVVPDGEEVVGSRTSVVGPERENGHADYRLPATDHRAPLRVLLADDHEIVRQGLRTLLSDEHDVEVVGEAANGREAVDLAHRLKPDVIVMDVSMPLIEGHDATRQIKALLPQTRVIALSMYDQPEKMETMYRAGAERYVLKMAPSEELLAAIRGKAPSS
jgi:CheY-like chemotaxis protein